MHLPKDSTVVMVTGVYTIPLDANANSALGHLHSSTGLQQYADTVGTLTIWI